MGSGLMRGLISAGCPPSRLSGVDCSEALTSSLERQLQCSMYTNPAAAIAAAEVVVLAVKPQQALELLPQIRGKLATSAVLVSIMAGIDMAQLRHGVGHSVLVRAMPNLPVTVKSGITALVAGSDTPQSARDLATMVFAASGEVVWLQNEESMDAVTAISGSGPAYFFYLMECLQKSAVAVGLDPATARSLVLHTALGAARIATAEGALEPAGLRANVTSPGGTTEAAIKQLDAAAVAAIVDAAVIAARDRSVALRKNLPDMEDKE